MTNKMACPGCIESWKAWLRPCVIVFYMVLLLIALPLCVVELHSKDAPADVEAWFVGGIFVLASLPISLWGIMQHLVNYTRPSLQLPIIRILWMVPIYGLNSWFALMFESIAIYLDTMRECYEAYVVYSFMTYLLNFLHSEHADFEAHMAEKPARKLLCPCCCCPPWNPGRQFINRCKHGVLQYTIVRPVTTVIALCCELGGIYKFGEFNFKTAYTYLLIVDNISQGWAMYCLILFYTVTREELNPIKPVSKFLCIKAVVFFTFWQNFLIAILVNAGVIQKIEHWKYYDAKEITMGLQNFLICVEMFIAAIAHYFSFSHKPYIDADVIQQTCCESFMSMWDVSDVRDDVVEHVRVVGSNIRKRVPGKAWRQQKQAASDSSERTPLLGASSSGSTSAILQETAGYEPDNVKVITDAEVHPEALRTASKGSANAATLLVSSTESDPNSGTFRATETDSMTNLARFGSSIDSRLSHVSTHSKDSGQGHVRLDVVPVSPYRGRSTSRENPFNNVIEAEEEPSLINFGECDVSTASQGAQGTGRPGDNLSSSLRSQER